jgi:hypothetical protein
VNSLSRFFEDLKTGLEEAIEYEKNRKQNNFLQSDTVEKTISLDLSNKNSKITTYNNNKAQD